MISFTTNQAKTQFSEMITKAQREPISITKNGKPSVVVMSVEDYNRVVHQGRLPTLLLNRRI